MERKRRAGNSMTRLLESPDKGVNNTSGTGGVLARLFRLMLAQNGINGGRYGNLMQKFLRDPRNGYADNRRERSSTAGNFGKEFSKEHMTWKVFVRALQFLRFSFIKITIEATHLDSKRTTVYSTVFNVGDYEEDENDDDPSEESDVIEKSDNEDSND